MTNRLQLLVAISIILLVTTNTGSALRLQGSWKRSANWDYFTRFCFKKSEKQYGNFTWTIETKNTLTVGFYDDQKGSWDSVGNTKDTCLVKNSKAKSTRSITNHTKSTETFEDTKESHMWYFALSDCSAHQLEITQMDVHIWNPMVGKYSQEFSCEQEGLLALNIIYFILFTIVCFVQLFVSVKLQRTGDFHTILRFFLYILILRTAALLMNLIHFGSFAQNGMGSPGLIIFAGVVEVISQIGFFLIIIAIGLGWTINVKNIPHKKLLLIGSGTFLLLFIILIIAAYTVMDYGTHFIAFEAVPGILLLIFRLAILGIFLFFTLKTYRKESNKEKKSFFKKLMIIYGIWLGLIPIFIFISFGFSDIAREKATTAHILTLDFLAFVCMVYLLWPSVSKDYFKLTTPSLSTGEAQELKSGSDWAALADEGSSSSSSSSSSSEEEEEEKDKVDEL
ncbi:intimal thickness receptor-related [Anaeramoeba flamelloides]|uniref:Intimal thickness receptor-related n=1 Tax=Anaeramoeba flamelloides TaxID=1746091 RepID=A0ABQ8XRS8_9EUKA|nr:intimal thickness receptor-related [Anaeramoeba flamelloides]